MSFDISSVKDQIDEALSTAECEAEIAFFGGSFTGIDRSLMTELLDIAEDYIEKGRVTSIRLSTRPDYISTEILDILKRYSVKTIELGIQSASDRVLASSKRGHTCEDTVRACALIKEYGFTLGGQMMIGLPSSTVEDEINTARIICEMGASECRIYPIVILKNTELEKMAERGEYIPLTENELIERSADALQIFEENNVKVLRIGLHSGTELSSGDEIACGYYHPAMGEMVYGEVLLRRIRALLKQAGGLENKGVTVIVPRGKISQAIGQKGRNRDRLTEEFSLRYIKFKEGDSLAVSIK